MSERSIGGDGRRELAGRSMMEMCSDPLLCWYSVRSVGYRMVRQRGSGSMQGMKGDLRRASMM